MSAAEHRPSRAEAIAEASNWGVGLGILVVALFPLSLPILLLTAVALLPLAVPAIALALVVAAVAVPALFVRRIVRRLRGRSRAGGRPTGSETAPRMPGEPSVAPEVLKAERPA